MSGVSVDYPLLFFLGSKLFGSFCKFSLIPVGYWLFLYSFVFRFHLEIGFSMGLLIVYFFSAKFVTLF